MVPSIAVMPRDGSFALAFFGRIRNIHESVFPLSAGRKSFALKRIVVLVIFLDNTNCVPAKQQLIYAQRLFEPCSTRHGSFYFLQRRTVNQSLAASTSAGVSSWPASK